MSKTFLFRFDGARENDDFLEAARTMGNVVYAGLGMALQRGWIPDFVEVVLGEDGTCSITLVELEATENRALVGARKYLAESSELDPKASVRVVFEKARNILSEHVV